MAGDWIPMRIDLADDPAVISIAVATKLTPDHVVGKLHRIWSWADKNSIDGLLHGVPESWIDDLVKKRGFAAAMASTKPHPWLLIDGHGLTIPRFDRWNSRSAKARLENTLRQRMSRNKRDEPVTEARAQNITEHNISNTTTTPSPIGDMTWEAVADELSAEGMGAADKACLAAKNSGCLPHEVYAVLQHWRSHRGAWGIGLLYKVIEHLQPDRKVSWPDPSPAYLQQKAKADLESRQQVQHESRKDGQRERERLSAERTAMESRFGGELDAIPKKKLREWVERDWPTMADSVPKRGPVNGLLRDVLLQQLSSSDASSTAEVPSC